MAAKPRSALTDALAGKGSSPEDTVPPLVSALGKGIICPPDAWPCLYPELWPLSEDTTQFPTTATPKFTPGSHSLAASLGGPVADFEENPFSRRKDELPPGSLSLNTQHLNPDRWAKLGSASITNNFLSDAVVGSLPKGLTAAERDVIRNSVPESPALDAIRNMPEERIAARTPEGRALRRKLLKGLVVCVIVAGYSGKRFVYEKLKEMGLRVVIIDGPDSWSRSLEEEGVIEKFLPIDWSDEDGTLFERLVDTVKKAEKVVGQLDAVMSFWDLAQALVARVAERLGLPGNPPSAVDAAREKQQTREKLGQAGLPTPKNYLIKDSSDIALAAATVGFPAVIKPISGAGSFGVIRVDSLEHLEVTYTKAIKELASVRMNSKGEIHFLDDEQLEEEKKLAATGHVQSKTFGYNSATETVKQLFLMEQYLDGPEVDVDIVMSKGEAVYGVLTDNWPTIEPYFNETGSNCPSILPLEQQRALCELAVQCVKALGFHIGVYHVELKYTSFGPHLIEVNARMGGGPVRDINSTVWGVDLVEEQLLASLGIPSKPLVAKRPLKFLAEYSVNAQITGTLENTEYLADYEDHPDVVYVRYLVDAGAKVTCVEDGLPTWVYEVMAVKPTVEEAIEFVKQVEQDVKIPIKPKSAAKLSA